MDKPSCVGLCQAAKTLAPFWSEEIGFHSEFSFQDHVGRPPSVAEAEVIAAVRGRGCCGSLGAFGFSPEAIKSAVEPMLRLMKQHYCARN